MRGEKGDREHEVETHSKVEINGELVEEDKLTDGQYVQVGTKWYKVQKPQAQAVAEG